MRRKQLIASLRQIGQLVTECLEAAGDKAKLSQKHLAADVQAKNTLPPRILELRDKSFFAQPKTARDVHAKLSASYPCELNRVEVALPRLAERKKLRKASKQVGRKKQAAYVW